MSSWLGIVGRRRRVESAIRVNRGFSLPVDFQEQTVGFAKARGLFQCLEHMSFGGGIARLMQKPPKAIVRLGRIRRLQPEERSIGIDGALTLVRCLARLGQITIRL